MLFVHDGGISVTVGVELYLVPEGFYNDPDSCFVVASCLMMEVQGNRHADTQKSNGFKT